MGASNGYTTRQYVYLLSWPLLVSPQSIAAFSTITSPPSVLLPPLRPPTIHPLQLSLHFILLFSGLRGMLRV